MNAAPDPPDCTDATEHQDVERLDLDDTGPPRYRCGTEWTEPDDPHPEDVKRCPDHAAAAPTAED